MLSVLSKIFVRSFYRANTGFFLFFFFLFFGAVEGNSLPSYHLSLMNSILTSKVVLLLVLSCWLLYHLKCVSFFLKSINGAEGSFLINLQTISKQRQWVLYTVLYASVYAPVFAYGCILFVVGVKRGYEINAILVLLFQLVSIAIFTGVIYYRINNWLQRITLPSFRFPLRKHFPLLLLFYFTTERKKFLFLLKGISLLLLYTILVWNKTRYDNDAFLYFYLVLLLIHSIVPYLSFQFFEKAFSVCRNLPISLSKRSVAFFLPYLLFFLPEVAYIFYQGDAIPLSHKIAYSLNLPVSLFLLTAFLYSEAQSREEYLKATFALFFVSLFALHVQAFWFWIAIQVIVATILFVSGYYSFERKDE